MDKISKIRKKVSMKKAIAVISGGMDSVTMLYEYAEKIGLACSFHYGSKHNDKEIPFAIFHSESLGIKHITIPLDFMNKHFKSDLLESGGDIPDGHYKDTLMQKTVVPFRNGIMLSIAAGLAESYGLNEVLIANHFGDHSVYPDCRESFILPMAQAIKAGTYGELLLMSPYVAITKRDIAIKGQKLGLDYSQTWSCYKGQEYHCGTCGTCIERKEALRGFDNTEYV